MEKVDPKTLFGNSTEGWELIKSEEHGDIMHFFQKIDGDTTKKMILAESPGGAVELYEYEKEYPSDHGISNLLMLGPDTLYFYNERNNEKTFVVGEYAYLFRKMTLDSAARQFYVEHADSLRKVKGNKLPALK